MKACMIVLKDFCENVSLKLISLCNPPKTHHHLPCLWSFLLPLRSLPANGDISRPEAVTEIAN